MYSKVEAPLKFSFVLSLNLRLGGFHRFLFKVCALVYGIFYTFKRAIIQEFESFTGFDSLYAIRVSESAY